MTGLRVSGVSLIICLLLLMSGCISVRNPVPPEKSNALAVALEKRSPVRFQVVHSVVVSLKPHWYWPTIRQAALGCANVDRAGNSCSVVCLSPLGMKLFDITCTNGVTTGGMLIPVEGDRDVMLKAMGEAVSRAFLDVCPAPLAPAVDAGGEVIFSGRYGNADVEYTLAGDGTLARKKYFERGVSVMTISYAGYQSTNGLIFPGRMTLEDPRRGYSIDFTVKSISEN